MKRTNLMIDEALLIDATRASGETTYSATVNRALAELLRRSRAHALLDLRGTGAWTGDLGEMRADRPARSRKKAR
jgi:Arc/MetJ family transcription regulator